MIQRLMEECRASVRNGARRAAHARAVVKDWHAAVMKEVGATRWRNLLEQSRRLRASGYGIRDLAGDLEGVSKLARARRESIEKSLAMLRESGIDPADLKKIHLKFANRRAMLGPVRRRRQRLEILPEGKVPEAVRKHKTNP